MGGREREGAGQEPEEGTKDKRHTKEV